MAYNNYTKKYERIISCSISSKNGICGLLEVPKWSYVTRMTLHTKASGMLLNDFHTAGDNNWLIIDYEINEQLIVGRFFPLTAI